MPAAAAGGLANTLGGPVKYLLYAERRHMSPDVTAASSSARARARTLARKAAGLPAIGMGPTSSRARKCAIRAFVKNLSSNG